jgi:hypothetical protein
MTTAALVTAAAVDTGGKFRAGVKMIKENLGTLVVNLPLLVYQHYR